MIPNSSEEQLIWLLQTMRGLFTFQDVERCLNTITDAFLDFNRAERSFFFMYEPDTEKLLPCCARGIGGLKFVTPEARVAALAQQVLRNKQILLVEDAPTLDEHAEPRTIRLIACAPVFFEDQPVGVFYADSHAKHHTAQTHHLQLFCDIAGAALENARRFERASNDLLTGLPNHSSFMAQFQRVLKQPNNGYTGGILLLDLDTFKRVNQIAGMEQGDKALQDIAQTLREVLCADGLVARYGSDKFAVLVPPSNATTPIAVRLWDIAERARAALGAKIYHTVQISTCVGAVGYHSNTKHSAQDIIVAADRVLSVARQRGNGQIEIATDTIQ